MQKTQLECDLIKDEKTELKKLKYIGDIKSLYIIKDIFSFILKNRN